MKIVEITPRKRSPLYVGLIKRQADISKNGRGTFARKGRARAGAATWNHKRFKVSSRTPEDEGGLLKAFLGFVDRHFGAQVATITIHYH